MRPAFFDRYHKAIKYFMFKGQGLDIKEYLTDFIFREDGAAQSLSPPPAQKTRIEYARINGQAVPRYINEFWTSKQRQACSIHEISYRACFKPQLPKFFVELLTRNGDTVYDPFSGRGTTVIEAALLGRKIIANDVNPLSKILTGPRLHPPRLAEVETRLDNIPIDPEAKPDIDLSMFYHTRTLAEIVSIKNHLAQKKAADREDDLDRWIRMVATNRLTGHSKGFFSVYTLPPNQAVSPENQIRINERRGQKPEYRDTKALILKKTRSLLRYLAPKAAGNLIFAQKTSLFLTGEAAKTKKIASDSVQLTVTSPPFLNIVQYSKDNWLRCWFNGLNADSIAKTITMAGTIAKWSKVMGSVFQELFRVTRPGGWVAFEVGEVRNRRVNLDEHALPLGMEAGFRCEGVLINQQEFTKTSNIWGVKNNSRGTNTNRVVLFQKPF